MDTIPAPLKGKVAIVTGASRGIGKAIVQKFAEHGCSHIAITYSTNKSKAEEVLAGLHKINPQIKTHALAADVFDPDSGAKIVKDSLAGLGTDRINIVVANAAYADVETFMPVADMTKDFWDRALTANAWSPLALARESIGHMPRGGRIIMISSGSSKVPSGDPFISYAAGKAALDAITRNLAAAWGVEKGVTVNSISVGATDTDAFRKGNKQFGPDFESYAANFSLLKRVAHPDEVADIVAFVASPQAGWIIGNQIPANGGGLSILQS